MDRDKKARAVVRSAFTRLHDKLVADLNSEEPDRCEIQANVALLSRKVNHLMEFDKTIFEHMLDADISATDFEQESITADEYQRKYERLQIEVLNVFNTVDADIRDDANSVHLSQGTRRKFKLPKIELKRFGGDIKDWLHFWSQFRKIDEDDELADEDKFQYLIQVTIEGSRARELVNSFPPTGENYKKVIEGLKSRFGREDMLVEVYVRELLTLVLKKVLKKGEQMSLCSLYDKLESQLRALDSLGVTSEKYAAMLFPLVESSMPEELLRAWQRTSTASDNVELACEGSFNTKNRLNKLMDFLRLEVENDERITLATTGFNLTGNPHTRQKKMQVSKEEDVPTAAGLINVKNGKPNNNDCIFCEKKHSSLECFKAKKMTLEEKKKIVHDKNCCYYCLKTSHFARRCKMIIKCLVCEGRHLTLMCPKLPAHQKGAEKVEDDTTVEKDSVLANHLAKPEVILQTLVVKLKGNKVERLARAIIDTGSQKSYVMEKTAGEMGFEIVGNQKLKHSLFGGVETLQQDHKMYRVCVSSINEEFECKFDALNQQMIVGEISHIKIGRWMQQLREANIIISDIGDVKGPIEILIGADIAGKLFTGRQRKLECGLVAIETDLGWTLLGKVPEDIRGTCAATTAISMFVKDAKICDLWELETLGIKDPVEVQSKHERDLKVKQRFVETIQVKEDGRYEIKLPWVDDRLELPTNYEIAKKRLYSLTRKLKIDGYLEGYDQVLKDWYAEGIIEEVYTQNKEVGHYIPHRHVVKENSTTRIRPVFDASARAKNRPSLNDCLETGPNMIELIPVVLLRFRMNKIGVIADIKRAFLQVSVSKDDREFLKFLWWDENDQIKVYRHARVVFGVSSSPFLLAAVIGYHLNKTLSSLNEKMNASDAPISKETVTKLISSFYVDNCVTSVSNHEELERFIRESRSIMASARFELRAWEHTSDESDGSNQLSSVLGLKWNKCTDTLEVNTGFLESIDISRVTKRLILSVSHKLYDPIGFLCPITLYTKLLLQQTWTDGLGWDTEVGDDMKAKFVCWYKELFVLSKIKIPRWLFGERSTEENLSIHTFCDASKAAYAAAVFMRVESTNGVCVQLIQAKSRVAPLKKMTIPRLELMAATVGVRLTTEIIKYLEFTTQIPVTYWSDSTTVLTWIKQNAKYEVFVKNRVEEIHRLSKPEDWKHVAGENNPADLPSRGCSTRKLLELRWWEGPAWLRLNANEWPEWNPLNNEIELMTPPARSWIEATFQKRDCIKFVQNPKDEFRCYCGKLSTLHVPSTTPEILPTEIWLPSKNTKATPTDAYGTIEFQGGPHPTKAQYVRVAYDTRPELLLQLFTREWNLETPKLLITVQGGKANFELQPKLKKVLRKGLLKAAKTTGAWIFTGGTNTGVTRQVGDALLLERSSGRVVSLGIAPWGIVENNYELIGLNRDVPFHSISSPRSKYAALNNRHAYFLLVDNGTQGRYGAEIVLRRKLEKFISIQRLHPYTHSSTPVVCLVIEGGTNTIRAVLEYVTDNPPVPVVVCDGSGRAADLIAFTHKYACDSESGEQTVLESMKDYLIGTIQRTFEVGLEQAECLYGELLQCTRKKNLITIFRISEKSEGQMQELDQTILTALFKSQHLTPSEQLSLSLTWNRVDIARSEIFVYGQEWPPGALNEAMMQALEHDRTDFVKLLLENGVSMRKFLTIPRLEELYNTKQGPSNTLGYILRDVRPHIPRGYVYTLHDIGLVINKLMGGAYRAFYTRRKFRPIYAKVMNKIPHMHRNSSSFVRYYGNAMSLLAEALPSNQGLCLFDYPFNELLIWAVLMKRQKMALLMWQHGEEALAKALVGCKLYKAMAHEAAEDDMETEVYEELRSYGKEFENIALELLDFCYRQDDDQTQQLLTCELQNWSGQTCLSLAVAANHRALLAHPCSQIILADLWMGGLRTRKNTNLKVILGLLFPPYILQLEFKSKEELQLMPQTEEEHLELENDDDDKSESEKNPDGEKRSRSLSIRNKAASRQGVKALLTENFIPRETVVQENGKVLPEIDELRFHFPLDEKFTEKTRTRPLKVKKKLYEFFTAPIAKFWANSIAYVIFLMIFSYVVLVKMGPTPTWQEYLGISFIAAMGCEKVREILSTEPVAISHKLAVWSLNMWNPCDAVAIIFFLIGLSLRLQPETFDVGRVMYCVDSIYWYLRILNILGVNKYLGPLVTMMGKMVKNMIYFVVLLLVVLMSFGVCRQAILYPSEEPSWMLARNVFYEPYFMLYGEVFADGIDPPCGGNTGIQCLTGRWITPAVMSVYLLVANILLINLLIAVFNNIFMEVNAVSHQVWMFQRFTVVMEYEQKPILPPPFIFMCHLFLLFKYFTRKMKGIRETYDNGLKLFLEKEDLERLYDFEEECVEGYFAEQEYKLQQSTDERIKLSTEKVENILQKVEDINTKENNQTSSMQSVEFRLRKVEEASQDILSHLAVIHRFMATRSNEELPPIPIVQDRLRKTSERSDVASEDSHLSVQPPRRKPIRSLTEVRPDAYIFDDGLHFEVRPVEEEDETSEHMDAFSASGSHKHLNILEERQRSCESKTSVESVSEKEEETQISTDDLAALNLDILRLKAKRRRGSAGNGRRSSDGGNGEDSIHGSRPGLTNRQFSQTHSEPDNSEHTFLANLPIRAGTVERSVTFAEPRIKVIPPTSTAAQNSPRAMLMAMHTEYTSITDELETVCGLLSPPRTPNLLSPPRPGQNTAPAQTTRRRHASEMSNPEIALYIEKEHLRDAEESDYMLMENLIQRRYDEERDENAPPNPAYLTVLHEAHEFVRSPLPARALRRSSAIEDDITFQCPLGVLILGENDNLSDNAPSTSAQASSQEAARRQDSADSNATSDVIPLLNQQLPPRPSIIIDSSQLPIQREIVKKADSKGSLHMQSETMC